MDDTILRISKGSVTVGYSYSPEVYFVTFSVPLTGPPYPIGVVLGVWCLVMFGKGNEVCQQYQRPQWLRSSTTSSDHNMPTEA